MNNDSVIPTPIADVVSDKTHRAPIKRVQDILTRIQSETAMAEKRIEQLREAASCVTLADMLQQDGITDTNTNFHLKLHRDGVIIVDIPGNTTILNIVDEDLRLELLSLLADRLRKKATAVFESKIS